MEDHEIIDLYFARSENAIAQTDVKYGRYCRSIAYSILNSKEDTEECVNDTYLKAWNSMPPQRPQRLSPYLGRITRNSALDLYDHLHADKRGDGNVALALEELAECIPDGEGSDAADSIAVRDALNRFLASLSRKKRLLFVRRYWYLDTTRELALSLHMSETNVKVTLLRLRDKLKTQLQREGIVL